MKKDDLFDKTVENADNLLDANEFKKALKLYLQIFNKDSNQYHISLKIATCYFHLNNYKEAIKYYDLVLNNFSIDKKEEFNVLNDRGGSYFLLEQYEFALSDYKRALEINPTNVNLLSNLGDTYLKLKNYDLAIYHYSNAIKLDDKSEKLFLHRAYSYAFNLDIDNALPDLLQANKLNKKNKQTHYIIGTVYLHKNNIPEAAKYFSSSGQSVLYILAKTNNLEVAALMLDLEMKRGGRHSFFKKTLKNGYVDDVNSDEYKSYRSVYIRSLQIIILLHINNKYEYAVAHYTHKKTLDQLVFSNSPFRLNTILTANDPKEGLVLSEFLGLETKPQLDAIFTNQDYKAFISSFSFNHDSLNQYRLYGKENDKEATGVSIVFNGEFFNREITESISLEELYDNESDDNINAKKALFRCLYIDPITKQLVAIGKREAYTFYHDHSLFENELEDNFDSDLHIERAINEYDSFINILFIKIKTNLNELKEYISNKIDLNASVISELLLMLRHLTKHVAFKEEQECRMLMIDSITQNANILPPKGSSDFSKLYINYLVISEYIEKIFFAPKTQGFELFQIHLKRFGIEIKCYKSIHPLS